MKRLTALVLSLMLAAPAASVFAQSSVTFRLAHVYAPDHPFSKGMKQLVAMVKEKTGGKFVINEFPAGQLGSEKDIADSLTNGIIEMGIVGPGEIGKRYKPVLIFDAPYVFRGPDHAMAVLASPVGQDIWDGLAKTAGIRNLATLYYGTRYVTSNKAIKTPADMQGMKLRCPDQPLSVANAKAMGAKPTPMALSEVYLALQQGAVDGQENPIPTIFTQKFNEVQKCIILTGHVIQLTPIFINEAKLKKLPDAYRKALLDSVAVVAPQINADVINYEKTKLTEMQASGTQIITPDLDAFHKALFPVIKEFESSWGPGLYDKIQAVK